MIPTVTSQRLINNFHFNGSVKFPGRAGYEKKLNVNIQFVNQILPENNSAANS